MTKKQEVTKKEDTQLLPQEIAGAWGAEELTSDDVIIPKLLLMQGSSKIVGDNDIAVGDIVRSSDKQVVAKLGAQVWVVPFMMYKTWIISKKVNGQWAWDHSIEYNASNADLPWQFTDNEGNEMKREMAYNFYALEVESLKEGEMAVPVRIEFKGTSRKIGRKLANIFATCRMRKIPPCSYQIALSCTREVNEKGNKFSVYNVEQGDKTPVDWIYTCKHWYDTIKMSPSTIKHDEEEDVETETFTATTQETTTKNYTAANMTTEQMNNINNEVPF